MSYNQVVLSYCPSGIRVKLEIQSRCPGPASRINTKKEVCVSESGSCMARRALRREIVFHRPFVPVLSWQPSNRFHRQTLRKIAASYFRQVGPSLNLPMHPPPGPCLTHLILVNFICATPFDIAIHLLPVATRLLIEMLFRHSPTSTISEFRCAARWHRFS